MKKKKKESPQKLYPNFCYEVCPIDPIIIRAQSLAKYRSSKYQSEGKFIRCKRPVCPGVNTPRLSSFAHGRMWPVRALVFWRNSTADPLSRTAINRCDRNYTRVNHAVDGNRLPSWPALRLPRIILSMGFQFLR